MAGCEKSSLLVCFGLIMGLTAGGCFVFVTLTPCWYVSYAEASISPYENCYGLWAYCSSTGLCGYWLSGSLLGSHGVQRIMCRAMMVVACLLSLPALLLNCFGMKCVLLLDISIKKKCDLLKKASLCYGFAGLCSFCAATWYAIDVVRSVWGRGMAAEFSDGIFIGWTATAIALGATGCLYIGRIAMKKEEDELVYSINSQNLLKSSCDSKSNIPPYNANQTSCEQGGDNFGHVTHQSTNQSSYTYASEKHTYM